MHLKTIFLLRDKRPVYTKILSTNDSLSKRVWKKEFEVLDIPPPKVRPKKQITIYTSKGCDACDSIVNRLNSQNFIFRSVSLDERPDVKEQLGHFLSRSAQEMDSLSSPIISLGGQALQQDYHFRSDDGGSRKRLRPFCAMAPLVKSIGQRPSKRSRQFVFVHNPNNLFLCPNFNRCQHFL